MARLPQPGGDDGQWGAILNDYLTQSLTTTGDLRSNVVDTAAIVDGAVTEVKLASAVQTKLNAAPIIADGSITEPKLATAVQTKLNAAPVIADGTITEPKLSSALQTKINAAPVIADDSIVEAKLNSAVRTKLNATTPTASTSAAGIVRLATPAEVQTGTDAAKAVTAAGVKAAVDQIPQKVIFVDSLAGIPNGTPVDTLVIVRTAV